MVIAAAVGAVCGLMLGRRFKVLVLLPVESLAFVVAAMATVSGLMPAGAACLDLAVASVALQVGFAISGLRAANARPAAVPAHRSN